MEKISQNKSEAKGFYKLTSMQHIGFGSGDLAQNLIYQTVSMYLLIFYTNVFGISAAAAGVMFLIVRIVDVIWDPIVGAFVDKNNPKLGKYRTYLILGGIINWLCYSLFLEWFLRLTALRLYYLCWAINALYTCKCSLWCVECFTHARHRRDNQTHFGTYVYGKHRRIGCRLRNSHCS